MDYQMTTEEAQTILTPHSLVVESYINSNTFKVYDAILSDYAIVKLALDRHIGQIDVVSYDLIKPTRTHS